MAETLLDEYPNGFNFEYNDLNFLISLTFLIFLIDFIASFLSMPATN